MKKQTLQEQAIELQAKAIKRGFELISLEKDKKKVKKFLRVVRPLISK